MDRRTVLAAFGTAMLPLSATAEPRQRLLLLSGAAGGAFHEYGPALASVVSAHAPVDLDVQPTGGSNENIRAVARGDADLGLISMGPAYEAWEGRKPFAEEGAMRNLRALFPMYETPFSLVALKASGVVGLAGLEGRTVGVGPAGGPGQVIFEGFAKALGLRTRIATGSPADLARRVISGEVDAFWYGAGVPLAAFVEVLDKADALVFGLTDSEVATLRATYAYFAPYKIPAGSYKGQGEPVNTAAVWNFVIGSDRLTEDAAYAVTAAALGHTSELRKAYPVAAGTAAANVTADTFLPLHPGAIRFFREAGIALPSRLTAN